MVLLTTAALCYAADAECKYRKTRKLALHWPDPTDCTRYYRCTNRSVKREVVCAGDKVYNAKIGKCSNNIEGLCKLTLATPLDGVSFTKFHVFRSTTIRFTLSLPWTFPFIFRLSTHVLMKPQVFILNNLDFVVISIFVTKIKLILRFAMPEVASIPRLEHAYQILTLNVGKISVLVKEVVPICPMNLPVLHFMCALLAKQLNRNVVAAVILTFPKGSVCLTQMDTFVGRIYA